MQMQYSGARTGTAHPSDFPDHRGCFQESSHSMKSIACALVLAVCLPGLAAAQTEGRISVGSSVWQIKPTDGNLGSLTGIGGVVRLNPKRGWGPAAAFNWFRADVENPDGGGGEFARLRVRPLMAGVAYTIGSGRILTSFSMVAGPSFNALDLEDQFLNRFPVTGALPTIDIENSIVVRPGVSMTVTVAPRVAIIGFGGYMWNRPDVVYTDSTGTELRNRWKADAVVLSVGAVYSLF